MTVMVTGGNGFIGQRIVRILLARGEEVVSFDMAPPRSGSLNESDKFSFYRGDITQIPHLTEAINANSVDRIIHMAAFSP